MSKKRTPDFGSSDDMDVDSDDDSELLSEKDSEQEQEQTVDGFKLGEDMNYAVLLQEKRASEPPPESKKQSRKRGPKKRKRSDSEDDDSNHEDQPPRKVNKSLVISSASASQIDIDRNLSNARSLEMERIQQVMDERRKEKAQQKEYIDQLAFQGLVGVSAIVDQALGYDGSFGEHIRENEGIRELLSETLAHECADTKKTIQQYGKMGFGAILGLEYLSYRKINLGKILSAPAPSPQAGPQPRSQGSPNTQQLRNAP